MHSIGVFIGFFFSLFLFRYQCSLGWPYSGRRIESVYSPHPDALLSKTKISGKGEKKRWRDKYSLPTSVKLERGRGMPMPCTPGYTTTVTLKIHSHEFWLYQVLFFFWLANNRSMVSSIPTTDQHMSVYGRRERGSLMPPCSLWDLRRSCAASYRMSSFLLAVVTQTPCSREERLHIIQVKCTSMHI